jgi:hypothetical protein
MIKKIHVDDKSLKREYINYIAITRVFLEQDKMDKNHWFNHFQTLLEQRILYRYSINKEPYNGYCKIKKNEKKNIEDFFIHNLKFFLEKILQKCHDISKSNMFQNLNNIKNFNLEKYLEEMDFNIDNKYYNETKEKCLYYQNVVLKRRKMFFYLIKNKLNVYKKINNNRKNNIYVEYDDSGEVIQVRYKNIIIPFEKNNKRDNRLNLLFHKSSESNFVKFILRYIGYGITGQHCALPIKIYDYFYDNLGIKCEGFASPLNSKLLEKKDTIYCSLFYDTDKFYSSKGIFTKEILVEYGEKYNFTLNPPYFTEVFEIVYYAVNYAFEKIKRDDFIIVILIPKWINNNVYQNLKSSKYCKYLLELDVGKHYMNCNGRYAHMNGVVNSMFFMSKNKILNIDNHIKNITKLWNELNENDNQQSFFETPIFIN